MPRPKTRKSTATTNKPINKARSVARTQPPRNAAVEIPNIPPSHGTEVKLRFSPDPQPGLLMRSRALLREDSKQVKAAVSEDSLLHAAVSYAQERGKATSLKDFCHKAIIRAALNEIGTTAGHKRVSKWGASDFDAAAREVAKSGYEPTGFRVSRYLQDPKTGKKPSIRTVISWLESQPPYPVNAAARNGRISRMPLPE